SLISWARLQNAVQPYGPRNRPTLIGGPELVIEVRSPSNRRAQERRKRRLYFANNVQTVWDVDADRQLIWVYHAAAPMAPQQYGVEDELDCTPFLPSWRRVADIFAEQASAEAVAGEVAQAWRAEGRDEGISETLRAVLPLLVQGRFGTPLPAQAIARLAQCPLPQLQRLQTAVQTSTSLEAWLQVLAFDPTQA
ncbi:MAG: Uma2 family endonuclease, partial [Candidatus Tectomicrobia bacterium]|nr:Uma2 family endonuclease [Candidatus Tectomicrobia bacterium]